MTPGPDASKLEWALWALDKTPFFVFPLVPRGKDPLVTVYDASRDRAQIEAWWANSPEANIGYAFFKSGHSIVDLDVKDLETNGVDTWTELCREHGDAPTLTFKTMSGGYHLVYDDPEAFLPNKTKLWPGIDGRSIGGYGVGLGSYVVDEEKGIAGEYTIADNRPIAPLPEWVKQGTGGKSYAERQELKRTGPPVAGDEWDRPLSIEQGKEAILRELGKHPVRPHGKGGDNQGTDQRCFDLCARLIDYAISRGAAVNLLKEHWAPSFDLDWLAEKYDHAMTYRSNSVGCDRPRGAAETFGHNPDPAEQRAAEQRKKWEFRTPRQDEDLPDLEYWDDHGCLPKIPNDGCAVIAYGQKSSHKTGVVLKFCLDAALRQENPAKVLYLAPEGAHGIRKYRLPAACRQRGKTTDDLEGRWYTFSITPGLMVESEIAGLIEACREQGFRPDVVVIDTLTRAARNLDISAPSTGIGLVTGMETLAAAFGGATVVAITHPGKDIGKGSIGSSLQGSLAYAEWNITFDKPTGTVSLWVEKMKDGPQEFGVEFDVTKNAVPVVTGGRRTDHKPRAKGGRPSRDGKFDQYEAWVIEQLKLLKPGETINAATLADRIKNEQGQTESFASYVDRQNNFRRDLMTAAKHANGRLAQYVERVDGDAIEEKAGYRWRMPDELRRTH